MDERFLSRLQSGIQTVLHWEDDPALFEEIRKSIPFDELMTSNSSRKRFHEHKPKNKYERDDDDKYINNDLFLKRLTLYFQKSMTWMNNPECHNCGNKNTEHIGVRGPDTLEEKEGKASRVEMYNCPSCNAITTFPRYNSPRAIFHNRKGRCGEYANLFGCYCRALGFDQVRYILDWTDHVWVEVYSQDLQRYIMADSCEGLIDRDAMYEKGWNKKLDFVVGFSVVYNKLQKAVQVTDVTKRYTRQFNSPEFQQRRRRIVSQEIISQMMIQQVNSYKQFLNSGPADAMKRAADIDKREQMENKMLGNTLTQHTWNDDHGVVGGRISGDIAWRIARKEDGNSAAVLSTTLPDKKIPETVEKNVLLLPTLTGLISIRVTPSSLESIKNKKPKPFHHAITICDIACAVGEPGYNVVVLDERNGCILLSCLFRDIPQLVNFLKRIPLGRIVAICQVNLIAEPTLEDSNFQGLLQIFGCFPKLSQDQCFHAYVGQVGFSPSWSTYLVSTKPHSSIFDKGQINLQLQLSVENLEEQFTINKIPSSSNLFPARISGRLNNKMNECKDLHKVSVMTFKEKESLFFDTVVNNNLGSYIGYITKENHPIYWFTNLALPLKAVDDRNKFDNSWTVCHVLPKELAMNVEEDVQQDTSSVDVPVNVDFFTLLFGNSLLSKSGSTITVEKALLRKRLVAIYFSAHWCPPCKRFTPMLAEFYEILKDELDNALEIIFVSSDRDIASFNQYYGTMPWLALPFAERERKNSISMRFGIRGIPSLVVMDAISGEIISSSATQEISSACRLGNESIMNLVSNNWLASIPEESQMIMQTLQLSIDDQSNLDKNGANESIKNDLQSFLYRAENNLDMTTADRIKEIFSNLVAAGCDPSQAAADAIQTVANEEKEKKNSKSSSNPGKLDLQPWKNITCSFPVFHHGQLSKMNDIKKHIYSFNDGNDNHNCLKLEGLLLCKSKKSHMIIGMQSIFESGFDGTSHKCDGTDDVEWMQAKVIGEPGNRESYGISRIDGIWSEDGLKELVLVNTLGKESMSESYFASSTEGQRDLISFSLEIEEGSNLLGFHGGIDSLSSQIVYLGLVLQRGTGTDSINSVFKSKENQKLPTHVLQCAYKLLDLNENDKSLVLDVLKLGKKYLSNVQKDPSNYRFKSFKLTNKVFDRISFICGGVDLLYSIGFSSFMPAEDVMISIPVSANLGDMEVMFGNLIEFFS